MSTASSNSSMYAGSAQEAITEEAPLVSDYLLTTLSEAMTTDKLDQCVATQARASGSLHSQSRSLIMLNATAQTELSEIKQDFLNGVKTAKALKEELSDIQKRIRACQELAKKKLPVEWHNVRDGLVDDGGIEDYA